MILSAHARKGKLEAKLRYRKRPTIRLPPCGADLYALKRSFHRLPKDRGG